MTELSANFYLFPWELFAKTSSQPCEEKTEQESQKKKVSTVHEPAFLREKKKNIMSLEKEKKTERVI